MLSFRKDNQIFEKLVVKEEGINLKKIIERTKKELPFWNIDINTNEERDTNIRYASEGDLRHKEIVKKTILNYLQETHRQINRDNIDSIIKQYHIDYYTNLYSKKAPKCNHDKKIYDYFEKYVLREDDSFDKKYKRLCQIIYQECYGLSVIDEIADDINNVNGVWFNNLNQIRVQIYGLKRRVAGLKFENDKTYRATIENATSYDAPQDIGTERPDIFASRRNGSRVTATAEPIYKIPYLNIRNFNDGIVTKRDLLREKTHNEDIILFNELVFRGRPNFSIIGPPGAGKSTYLRMIIGEYDDNLGLLLIEQSEELRIEKYYPQKDVRTHIWGKGFSPSDLLIMSFREDRDCIFQGEIRTPDEAYVDIYVKQRIGRGSGDTYHAMDYDEYITTKRNLLMQTKLYQDIRTAEQDIANSNDLIYQLLSDAVTGRRYVNKILEIEKNNSDFRERVIIEYDVDTERWIIKNNLSESLYKKLRKERSTFTKESENRLRNLLSGGKA